MDHVIRQRITAGWEWLGMRFEGTISLGSVLNLFVILSGGIVFLMNYEHRMTMQEAGQQELRQTLAEQQLQLRQIEDRLQFRAAPVQRGGGQ